MYTVWVWERGLIVERNFVNGIGWYFHAANLEGEDHKPDLHMDAGEGC